MVIAFSVVLICLELCSSRLVGNYRLWDSWGETLYDFSGSSNHAHIQTQENSAVILTDRGQYLSNATITLSNNKTKLKSENYTTWIAFWYLPIYVSKLLTMPGGYYLNLNQEIPQSDLSMKLKSKDNDSKRYDISGFNIKSWNFFILRILQFEEDISIQFYTEISIPEMSYTYKYHTSQDEETTLLIGDFNYFQAFLYEIWCFDEDINIKNKLDILFGIEKRLGNTIDPYRNSYGEDCTPTCELLGFSDKCNMPSMPKCKNGWYDLLDPKCISRCPKGCICESDSEICSSCIQDYKLQDNRCIPKQEDRFLISCNIGNYECSLSCCPCPAFCDTCYINTSIVLECTLCASNYYILDRTTSFSCVSSCPEEYYKGIASPSKCEKCGLNCLKCENVGVCSICKSGYFLKLNGCVTDCGLGYYSNVVTSSCGTCSSGCDACSSIGDVIKCTQCNTSTYLKDGICLSSCDSAYYPNTTNRKCEQCSNNCLSCQYVGTELKCSGCNSITYLKDGICVAECGSGYYSNTINRLCQQCLTSSCDKCDVNLECTNCILGLGLQTISGIKVCQECPARTYLSQGTCINCGYLCQVCTSTTCSQCVLNASYYVTYCYCNHGYIESSTWCILDPIFRVYHYFMGSDGNIYFYFNHSLASAPSASLFTVQLGSSNYDSTSFNISAYTALTIYYISFFDKTLFQGNTSLFVKFPVNPNQLVSQNNIILETTQIEVPVISQFNSQLVCSGNLQCSIFYIYYNACICNSCQVNYCRRIVYPYPCSTCCDTGFYLPNGVGTDCWPCPSQCSTCDTSGCLSCSSGKYLLNKDCLSECGLNHYENTIYNTCTSCITNCEDCTDANTCIRCGINYVLNENSTQCIPCPSGKFYDHGACTDCPSICIACSSASNCSSCIVNGEIRTNNICYCMLGYLYSNTQCIYTEYHARAKIDTSHNIILSFEKQLMSSLVSSEISFVVLDTTYLSTSFSFVETLSKQIYEVKIASLTYVGVEFFTLNFLVPNKYALDQSKLHESSITIYICPIECDTCNADFCLSCNSGYYLKAGACINDCGLDYEENPDTRICQECPSDCQLCAFVSTDLKCIQCISGYGLMTVDDVVECVECFEGKYMESNNCLACPNLCIICSANEGCIACKDNAHIKNGLCVCNEDYSLNVNDCITYRDLHAKASVVTYGEIHLIFDKPLKNSLSKEVIYFSISDEFELMETVLFQTYSLKFHLITYFSSKEFYLYFQNRDFIISYDDNLLYEEYLKINVDILYKCPNNWKECHYEITDLVCDICDDGYFRLHDGVSYSCTQECPHKYYGDAKNLPAECKQCPEYCNQCPNNYCIECEDGMFIIEGECTEKCGLGYVLNLQSKACEPCGEGCIECDMEDHNIVCKSCTQGTYLQQTQCISCPELCKACTNELQCIECVESARISNEICVRNGYNASVELVDDHHIKLKFEKLLNKDLDSSYIQLKLGSVIYNYPQFILEELTPYQEYIIDLQTINISNANYLEIIFKDILTTQTNDGSYIESDTIRLNISNESSDGTNTGSTATYVSQTSYLAQDPQAQEIHSKGSIASGTITGSLMLLSFSSLSGLWFFINCLQMFSMLPLLNVDLPIMLFAFLASLRAYCPVPNLIEFIIPIEDPKPTYRAGLLGYETTQFLYNSGDMLSAFIFSNSFYLILLILKLFIPRRYSHKFISKKISKILGSFKWNTITRFFIETYIEFGIAAFIQVLKIKEISNYTSWNQLLNMILGCAMFKMYHLIKYTPFQSKQDNIVQFVTEFSISIVYSLTIFYLFDLGEKEAQVIQWIIIGTIMMCLLVNIGCVLFNALRFCRELIKKCRKRNRVNIQTVKKSDSNTEINTTSMNLQDNRDSSFYEKVQRRLFKHLDSTIAQE